MQLVLCLQSGFHELPGDHLSLLDNGLSKMQSAAERAVVGHLVKSDTSPTRPGGCGGNPDSINAVLSSSSGARLDDHPITLPLTPSRSLVHLAFDPITRRRTRRGPPHYVISPYPPHTSGIIPPSPLRYLHHFLNHSALSNLWDAGSKHQQILDGNITQNTVVSVINCN